MPAVRLAPSLVAERLPALKNPDFRKLWIGNMVSNTGGQMQMAALNWQVYELTHNPLALGAIGLVRVIPIILLSLVGGAVADRTDRRRLLLLTQSLMAGFAFVLGVLSLTGLITPLAIYGVAACMAGVVAFNNPAYQAIVPSVVGKDNLQSAITLGSTGTQLTMVIGPTVAGLTLARYGAGWAYIANAASFLAVIYALATLRNRPPLPQGAEDRPGLLASLAEGITFVRTRPVLFSTMLVDFVATLFASANALLPIYASEILHVGAQGYGYLLAAPAVGSLVTGIILSLLPPIQRMGRTLLWAVFGFGLATIAFGLSHNFTLSLVLFGLTGVTDTVSTIIRNVIRQTDTPDRMRGRMGSISMIFFMGGPQLGEMEAGAVANLTNAVVSVVSGGIASVLGTGLIAWRAPYLRNYERNTEEVER